jgi:hypothetical protein
VPFSVNRQLCAQAGAQEDLPANSSFVYGKVLMDTSSQTEREARAARNQSMFRSVNERLEELNETFQQITERFTIACECADTSCVEMLEIHAEEYEAVRAEPRHFVVLPGHIYPDVEDVVREADGYVVVEKTGTAAAVAEILDPRDDNAS